MGISGAEKCGGRKAAEFMKGWKEADCLIILGAKVHADGHLSRTLRMRVEKAVWACENGFHGVLIASGAASGESPCSEAEAIAQALVQAGIDKGRILLEDKSRDTWENLRHGREMMAVHGLLTAAVVTSRYHMPRALKMARDLGMRVCGLAAPAPAGKARIKAWLREAGGWAAYLVKIRQYRQK